MKSTYSKYKKNVKSEYFIKNSLIFYEMKRNNISTCKRKYKICFLFRITKGCNVHTCIYIHISEIATCAQISLRHQFSLKRCSQVLSKRAQEDVARPTENFQIKRLIGGVGQSRSSLFLSHCIVQRLGRVSFLILRSCSNLSNLVKTL